MKVKIVTTIILVVVVVVVVIIIYTLFGFTAVGIINDHTPCKSCLHGLLCNKFHLGWVLRIELKDSSCPTTLMHANRELIQHNRDQICPKTTDFLAPAIIITVIVSSGGAWPCHY